MTDGWADIERQARFCPFLHAAVTMVGQGMSREEALVGAALALSKANQSCLERLGDCVKRLPADFSLHLHLPIAREGQ